MKNRIAVLALLSGLVAAPVALSHLESTAFHLTYRQSVFAVLGANFGPIDSMIKGEMPWDDAMFQGFANDLATAASLNIVRGFPPGSEGGRTRAKPELWNNMDDFKEKAAALKEETQKLALVAQTGNKKAILKQYQKTGGTCKNCHDEYKSKDYLN